MEKEIERRRLGDRNIDVCGFDLHKFRLAKTNNADDD